MAKKTLLIDADIVVFQFACTNQLRYDWDDDVYSEVITPEEAIEEMVLFIDNLRVATETSELLFCFSLGKCFRYNVLPTYKHNRKDKERPILLGHLKDYIKENYQVFEKEGLEADDILGILGSQYPEQYVIATLDKDLRQIPEVWNYNWRTGVMDSFSLEEADMYFYTQTLTGDSTDGYKGCPGIGPVRAERLLEGVQGEKEAWQVVVEAYVSKGLTEEEALQQARVARILRHTDYDMEKEEVILWEPQQGQGY